MVFGKKSVEFKQCAHEGHDKWNKHDLRVYRISIHVPTRGTTRVIGSASAAQNFNPRAHEGHDNRTHRRIPNQPISIHVPTRGTTCKRLIVNMPPNFNPRAHEGHDFPDFGACVVLPGFQSTCPRGARLSPAQPRLQRHDFNPRAHEGHDVQNRPYHRRSSISIHVPTRGTTLSVKLQIQNIIFQSTCPRGARLPTGAEYLYR